MYGDLRFLKELIFIYECVVLKDITFFTNDVRHFPSHAECRFRFACRFTDLFDCAQNVYTDRF